MASMLLRLLALRNRNSINPSILSSNDNSDNSNVTDGTPKNSQGGDDEEINRIRELFSRETPGMEALRSHVSSMPMENDPAYKPSTGRKILGILAGAGQEMSTAGRGGTPDSRGGIRVADDIINDPYNKALENWNRRTKPLESVAALDEKNLGNQRQAEVAIEGVKTRRAISDQTHEQAQRALEERAREADQRSNDSKLAEADREASRRESLALRAEIAKGNQEIRRDMLDFRKNTTERTVADPNDPSKNIIVNKLSGEKVGDASIAGGDRTITSDANDVISGVTKLQELMKDPNVRAKMGAIKGKGENWLINFGASTDPDIIRVARELDTVEKKHTKLVGGTRSKAMIDDVRKGLGNIGQNPAGVDISLQVMKDSANDTIKARTPGASGKGKKIKLKDGSEVTVEE